MKNISIGKESKIDHRAIVGHKAERRIKSRSLHIGKNANIRSGSVIYEGSKIGSHLETGHNVVIREENSIGNNLSIWSNSVIDYGCKIGNNVKIHSNCYIAQFTTIEDNVFIAPGVMFANDPCPPCGKCLKGPKIKKGANIGINVTILPGVIIGEYSLIGAGAVVTKDVKPGTVVYGNPAQAKKTIEELNCRYAFKNPYLKALPELRKILKKQKK